LIAEARVCVLDYVDKEIEKMENDTKAFIESWIQRFLNTINAIVKSCNYKEAERRIKLAKTINRILGNLCGDTNLGDLGDMNEKDPGNNGNDKNIQNRVDTLEQQLETVLKETVAKYKDIKLKGGQPNPYCTNPPKELYAKLKDAQEGATYNYKNTWEQIEEDIFFKVREQLKKARKMTAKSKSRECGACLRLCDSVVQSLPDHMKIILKEERKQCREDIEKEKKTLL